MAPILSFYPNHRQLSQIFSTMELWLLLKMSKCFPLLTVFLLLVFHHSQRCFGFSFCNWIGNVSRLLREFQCEQRIWIELNVRCSVCSVYLVLAGKKNRNFCSVKFVCRRTIPLWHQYSQKAWKLKCFPVQMTVRHVDGGARISRYYICFFSVSHLFCVATMAVCPIDPVSTTATATDTEHCWC